MNNFVESLKRLYNDKKLTKKKLKEILDKGQITQEDYNYIIGG